MQKVRCVLPNCFYFSFSKIFSLPAKGSFQLSLTVLFTIYLIKYLGLDNCLPIFKQLFTKIVLLTNKLIFKHYGTKYPFKNFML